MANVLVDNAALQATADAIRTKNGSTNTYKPSEFADAITSIPTGSGEGGIIPTGTISITSNGTFDVTNYASANVNVASDTTNELPANHMKTGTFTVLENTSEAQVITHNAGVIPKYVLVVMDEICNDEGDTYITAGGYSLARNETLRIKSDGYLGYGANTSIDNITDTQFTILSNGSLYPFKSNKIYRWWIWF